MKAVVLRRAAAGGAEDAGRVGIVDRQGRVVLFGQLEDIRQLADVALHREDAVGDDEPVAGARRLYERLLESLHVRVLVDLTVRLRHADAVDD